MLDAATIIGVGFATAPWVVTRLGAMAGGLCALACIVTGAMAWRAVWRIPPPARERPMGVREAATVARVR